VVTLSHALSNQQSEEDRMAGRILAWCVLTLAMAASAWAQTVRVVYVVPSDREVRAEYREAIDIAGRDLQSFYQRQMGDGRTFTLDPTGILILQSTHDSGWFTTNEPAGFNTLYRNVRMDVEDMLGRPRGSLHAGPDVWLIYVDAFPLCGQCGGCGGGRVAVIARGDLRGLVGDEYVPTCPTDRDPNRRCRFIGGLGHELGHAMGLPHPPGCDAGSPTCDRNALMWSGYGAYPGTYLRADEKATLAATPYLSFMPALPPVAVCSNTAPSTPGAFAATVDGSAVRFSWTVPQAGSAPNSYILRAGSAPGLSNLANHTFTGPTRTLTVAAPPGSYYVRLIARLGGLESAATGDINVRVSLPPPPTAPTGLTADLSGRVAMLRWNAPAGLVDGYVLEAGSAPTAANLAILPVTTASFVSPQLAPGRYFVRVRARNSAGLGNPSPDLTLDVPEASVPGAPGMLAAAVTGRTISLSWNAPTTGGAGIEYVVEAGSAAGASNIGAFSTGVTPSFTAQNVPAGVYFVRVRARSEAGVGPASNEVTLVVTAPGDPVP
jgi:hypothetical protein